MRLIICADCGEAGPWVAQPHRAVRCPDCVQAFEEARNARRDWYQGDWASLRKAAVQGTGGRCQRCGSTVRVQVHHVSPRSLAGGLAVLCESCHQDEHG